MTERIRRLGVLLGVMSCVLLIAVTKLQVVDAERLQDHALNTRSLSEDFARDRGVIQTADGVVLARSEPSGDQFRLQRTYPEGPVFAPVTGHLSFVYETTGAEGAFKSDLTGGSLPAGDRSLRNLFEDDPRTGDVTLTIRADVQKAAAAALGNQKGAVVALDPTNGAVLALVSFPSYDPTPLAGHSAAEVAKTYEALLADPNKPLIARAYRESYPPGSTFKVVTAAAALDRKPELLEKDYPRLKQLDLPRTDKDLPNFGGGTCGGRIPDLLRVSCNTGFAEVGLDLGGGELSAEAGEFGFGERPPLDLVPSSARLALPVRRRFQRPQPGRTRHRVQRDRPAERQLDPAADGAGRRRHRQRRRDHEAARARAGDRPTRRRGAELLAGGVAHGDERRNGGRGQGDDGRRRGAGHRDPSAGPGSDGGGQDRYRPDRRRQRARLAHRVRPGRGAEGRGCRHRRKPARIGRCDRWTHRRSDRRSGDEGRPGALSMTTLRVRRLAFRGHG